MASRMTIIISARTLLNVVIYLHKRLSPSNKRNTRNFVVLRKFCTLLAACCKKPVHRLYCVCVCVFVCVWRVRVNVPQAFEN